MTDESSLTRSQLSRRHAGLAAEWRSGVQSVGAANGDPNDAADPDLEGVELKEAPIYILFGCRPPAGITVKFRLWLYWAPPDGSVGTWYRIVGSETEVADADGPALDELKPAGADRIYFERTDSSGSTATFDLAERT